MAPFPFPHRQALPILLSHNRFFSSAEVLILLWPRVTPLPFRSLRMTPPPVIHLSYLRMSQLLFLRSFVGPERRLKSHEDSTRLSRNPISFSIPSHSHSSSWRNSSMLSSLLKNFVASHPHFYQKGATRIAECLEVPIAPTALHLPLQLATNPVNNRRPWRKGEDQASNTLSSPIHLLAEPRSSFFSEFHPTFIATRHSK